MSASDLQEIVAEKIKNLRPKLLDLSRRNPLIATRLSPRSSSHIRVVDELPDVLFFKLGNDQAMRLVALPEIDSDPLDEDTKTFRDAASNARLTDDAYLIALEAVDRDAEDYLDVARRLERQLKDRVRDEFGMPKRQGGSDVNLVQHAKNNHITPSYDLPEPSETSDDRHADNDIQTLILPKDLERKLDTISAKCRTWIQETGINVLQIGYGFLEWAEPAQSGTSFAPLILSGAKLEKRRTRHGSEYWIHGAGEDAELNGVMQEKLRQFGIELPPFDGTSIEAYISAVAEVAPKTLTTWKARRQIAIGVFPSARMAMFHDLDPSHGSLHASEIVRSMLTGSNADAANPFGDEYDIDEPHIEASVPHLVLDADSSQFSTLVDIAGGKNVAVEGPPGTGKSQTIVNAIAAALVSGKKVLFVAEKLAALNVVKSRLDAVGLGEFLLTLQAERSTREQVIASIRERIEMEQPSPARGYEATLTEFKRARSELGEYIALITSAYKQTGFTLHELLGKAIATSRFDNVSSSVFDSCKIPARLRSSAGLKMLRQIAEEANVAHVATLATGDHWRTTRLKAPSRFTVDEACELAEQTAESFALLAAQHQKLTELDFPDWMTSDELEQLSKVLTDATRLRDDEARALLATLLTSEMGAEIARFVSGCERWALLQQELACHLACEPTKESFESIQRIAALCSSSGIDTLDLDGLQKYLQGWEQWLSQQNSLCAKLFPLVQEVPEACRWSLSDLDDAQRAIAAAGPTALLYRNSSAAEPGAVILLRKFCTEGIRLAAEMQNLQEVAPSALDTSVDQLAEWLATLQSAGALSILSPRFRRTKALVCTTLVLANFDKAKACETLSAVVAFKRREVSFTASAQATSLFGPYFSGLQSDFSSYQRLAEYYETVNTRFATPEGRSLRQYLRSASTDALELIPSTVGRPEDSLFGVPTFETLSRYISQIEATLNTARTGAIELKSLVGVFLEPAAFDIRQLSVLSRQVETFLGLTQLLNGDQRVAAALGDHFHGALTETSRLRAVCEIMQDAPAFAETASSLILAGKLEIAHRQLLDVIEVARATDALMNRLCSVAHIAPGHIFEGRAPNDVADYLRTAGNDREGLYAYAALSVAFDRLNESGIDPLAQYLLGSEGSLAKLADLTEASMIRALTKSVYAEHGQKLSKFSGQQLGKLRLTLAESDRQIIRLSRDLLRHKIYQAANPPRGVGTGRKSTWTQKALLDNEIAKQQRFSSVRDLTARAGQALLELKPCWMMSPLAVAQYVPKDAFQFDLCIIDEASQMPPESAIGAIIRAKQVVVVGDTNQLPPSSFFRTMLDDDDADEDDNVLNESILELANATFKPARRLRWHYRSRHSGLIKFSNRLVYDDNLVVFPSASEANTSMGVEYKRVDGLYRAGTNPIEARAVVDAILEFMRSDPNRSLGVVTLNQRQRDLIREELEYALATDTSAQAYVDTWEEKNDGLEHFFVKNLENVQGDERDVIFIGTVYGPESIGAKVHQRFGPINGIAGKRRLNVLFSRAKQKIVTFSSMTSADIVAEENGNIGAYMLKRWLDYSATGLLDAGTQTSREPDSDFEVFVSDQIRAMGLEPVHQVGVAGYFIDIGVRHPEWPYGYVLGVECDGASYHSAKSARDRDRLRQEVLEGLGWKLHRIWSTDWFNNPRLEAERLRAVVDQCMQQLKSQEQTFRASRSDPLERKEQEVSAQPEPLLTTATIVKALMTHAQIPRWVEPGDTVRIRYLDTDTVLQFIIHHGSNEPELGLINVDSQLAKAVLGADIEDEIEVLLGSYVRRFAVEAVTKANENQLVS